MCGEIDEQVLIGQELLDRSRAMAKRLNLPEAGGAGEAPSGLAEEAGRAAYMEQVFRNALARALDQIARAEEDQTIDALAAQAIALARVAGFLAGQLPPEADLYRAIIESATAGHGETRDLAATLFAHHHHHPHDHDSPHDHH